VARWRAPQRSKLNSTVSPKRRQELLAALERGEHEFVLLAPEQDAKPEVLEELGAFAERLGRPAILALTATASPPVRREIVERLGMADPAQVIRGFDRPNLHFAVRRFSDAAGKEEALVAAVAVAPKPGIVYIATRKASEELAISATGDVHRASGGPTSRPRSSRASARAASGASSTAPASR
jgi:ATP-dependent DNA helicase RecQ